MRMDSVFCREGEPKYCIIRVCVGDLAILKARKLIVYGMRK